MLDAMTLLFRALILGYAVAFLAAAWLHAFGMALWMVCCIAWIGGNVLGLAFTAVGAVLRPALPERGGTAAAIEAELRLWEVYLSPKRVERGTRPELARAADGRVGARRPALVAATAGRRRSS